MNAETKNYSVLMSVYSKERADFLRQSVDSVFSQTILPNDFVLVCDGTLTDELNKTIDELRKKYRCIQIVQLEKNSGLGVALSAGLEKTKNELVMRMDSDDICLSNRAAFELPLMETYDLVGGFVSEFEGEQENIIGVRIVPEGYEDIHRFAKKRNPFNHPTVMFRKSVILAAGGYKPLKYLEDYYLWVRLLLKNKKVHNVQKILVNMRSGTHMRVRRSNKDSKSSIIFLRKFMFKNHFIGLFSYIFGTFLQLLAHSLPLKIRLRLYNKVLRKKAI